MRVSDEGNVYLTVQFTSLMSELEYMCTYWQNIASMSGGIWSTKARLVRPLSSIDV